MTKFQQSIGIASICIVVFLLIMGWAGEHDYCEQIIYRMSQEEYDSVKQVLTEKNGEEPSDSDIAHWWADHQDNLP